MSGERSNADSTNRRSWFGRHQSDLILSSCFLLQCASSLIVGLRPEISVIWVANGLLLAYLLLAPQWRWPWYFATGFAGQFAGAMMARTQTWPVNLALTILNMTEVALAITLLRGRIRLRPRFTDPKFLMRFLGCAVLAAPASISIVYALIAHAWVHRMVWPEIRDWFTTDALGMAVATPAFVAIFRTRFRDAKLSRSALIYPLLFAAAVPLLFRQNAIPAMAILFPLLILIQLRLGLGWASAATLLMAAAGSLISERSQPGASSLGLLGPVQSGLHLQLMVASAMFMLYAISMVVDNLRQIEKRLRETVYLHNLVTENSRDVIIIADFQGRRSYVSAAHGSLGGWDREELLNLHSMALVHPDDRPRAEELVRQLHAGRGEAVLECQVRKRNGEYVWVEASLRTIRDSITGNATGILNIVRDISERKRAEESRQFHQSLLAAIHEGSLDGILIVDDHGKAVSYNRRFAEVWQITAPAVPRSLLKPVVEVLDEYLLMQCIDKTRDPDAFVRRVQELYADRHADDHCQVELKDGRTLERYTTALHTDDGRYLGRVWFFRDVTERIHAEQKLKAAYEEVERLAVIDPLTGIANRRRLDAYLRSEWRRAMRDRRPISAVVMDVDLFKLYNDTHGHVRGDMCLKQIADSAVAVVTRAGDLVARFGGEEFAIVLPNTDERGAFQIAQHISDAVSSRRIPHHGSPFDIVTVSAGCATIIPDPGMEPSLLIDNADRAMYEAKRQGRNRVCVSETQEMALSTPRGPETAP